VELWQQGDWRTFLGMLPMYAGKCWGEGDMHDTAMLLGMLGWDEYRAPVEVVTPYFGSSGTGQINAVFPVTPQSGGSIPRAQASSVEGYQAASRL
jgi:3,4-dihydroxyphenylacetate 2,3-dioxygenase